MSSQIPPNPIVDTYNPAYWGEENIAITASYLAQNYLQFPFAQGDETFGGISVNAGADFNGVMTIDGVATFSVQPLQTATQPASTDATTKIPTTAWVQSALNGGGGGGSSLLSSSNTWTNTNNFQSIIDGTAPAPTSNSTEIPTTAWVNDAISTAISNITPSVNTTFSNTFDGTAISYSYNVPADAQYFNFSGCGCGGRAGANAVYNIQTGGSTIPIPNTGNFGSTPIIAPDDFQLWAGGQGGGGLGNSISNIPNSSVGLAGQTITFTCSGNGNNYSPATYVEATWTNSITGLPMTIRLPNGYNGDDASSVNPSGGGSGAGGAGVGGLIANAILPSLVGGSWITWTPPNNSAPAGSPGSSSETPFYVYLQPTPGDTPYQVLSPAYNPTTNANGAPWLGGAYPTAPVSGSGTTGFGQYLSSFYTPTDIIYYDGAQNYYGNDASPIGQGFFTLNCFTSPPNQVGGTNASFIAYDDADPTNKTKQIYTDKEGLVVSQELNTTPKTTTLTPTDLKFDNNGTITSALISDIINVANNPPATPTLTQVLTAGNTATNSIALNNTGTGTNVISLLPNNSSSNPAITLTDGTTTNTIDKNGYTTRNSVQNATHYLNFSDNSSTGTGAIQKTAGINCNPSTNTITATTFVGALSGTATTATTATNATNTAITATTTNATYYPTFVSATSGNLPQLVDTTLTYNPSTDTLTATTFSGTATNTTNVGITADNTSGTYYLPFVKTSGAGNKPLFIDDTTGPLTYNPSTGVLTAVSYSGSGANLTGIVVSGLNNQNPTSITASSSATPTTLTSGRLNLVAITSPSNNYCILPTATSGTSISVFNQSSTLTLNIFPPSGQAIDLGATNGFITINPYSCIDFVYSSNWLSQRPSYASQVYYYYPNAPSSNYPSSVYNLINATGYDYSGGGVQTNSFARMTTGGRQLEVGNYEGNSGYECYTQYDATNSQLTQLSSSGGGGFSRLSASLFAVGVYTPPTYTTRVSLDCSTTGAITQIPNATTTYAGTSTKNTLYQGINVVGSISSNQTLTSTNYFLVNIYTPSTAGLNIILPTATGVNSGTWIIIKNQSATQTLTIQYNPTPTTLATLAPYTTSANVVSSYKFIVGGGVWYVISG